MFLMTGLDFILQLKTLTGLSGRRAADARRSGPTPPPLPPEERARALARASGSSRSSEIAVGRRIVDREVVGGENPESPFRAGELVYAHSAVPGQKGGFVEHVWSRDGEEIARHYLPIGNDRRWRTWSRHRLHAGDYVVEVFAPDGRSLARHHFTAFPSAARRPRT